MTWLAVHWPLLVSILGPSGAVFVSTIINVFGDPDHDPQTPPPVWVVPFVILQGFLTLRAAPGRKGLDGIGDGRWSVPGHFPQIGEPIPTRAGVAPSSNTDLLVLGLLFAQIAGCACFKPEAPDYNSKACVVARQVVDCTKGSVIGLIMAVGPALAVAILSGAPIDLAHIAEQAEKGAIGNGLCLLAALEADLIKPGASSPRLAVARGQSHDALSALAHRLYGPGPVAIKVPLSGGTASAVVSVQ